MKIILLNMWGLEYLIIDLTKKLRSLRYEKINIANILIDKSEIG
jgi:hypothetical protein